jgi:hypothetical protein
MKRLMPVKSHTMRAPLPFGFSTKKAGLIHSVGSVTGTMTPESITFRGFLGRLAGGGRGLAWPSALSWASRRRPGISSWASLSSA